MAKRVEYLVALINEFGRKYGAISIYDECYEYLHTQSFDSAAQSLAAYCRRNGGGVWFETLSLYE